MSNQMSKASRAPVVNMVELLAQPSRKRAFKTVNTSRSAKLLSMRQSLIHQATIGLNDKDAAYQQLTKEQHDELKSSIRSLLYSEFGSLRVYRYRQVFTVGHYCVESLIAGLLRVQYHARQLPSPGYSTCNEKGGVILTWGIGETVIQAEYERQNNQAGLNKPR